MENWWKQSLEASLQPLVVDFSKSGCLSRVEAVDDCHSRYIKVVTVLLHVCVCDPTFTCLWKRTNFMPAFQTFPRKFPGIFPAFVCHGEGFCVVKFVNLPGPDFSSCFGGKRSNLMMQHVQRIPYKSIWKSHIFLGFSVWILVWFVCFFAILSTDGNDSEQVNLAKSGYIHIYKYFIYFPLSKLLILGMVIPAPIGNPGTGYSNPY